MAEVTFTGKDSQQIHTFCNMVLSPKKSFARQGVSLRDFFFRDGRVTKFGSVRRALTGSDGSREESAALIEFDDTDGVMTALNAATPFKGKECEILRIDDASRRAGINTGMVLFRGLMDTPQRSGFKFTVQVRDLISHDRDAELPLRRISPVIFTTVTSTNGNRKAINQVVPIIYGEHLGTTNEPWPIPVIPVDTEVINGVTFGRLLVCGHAVKEIVKVFRNGSNVTAAARVYIPGKASWTGNANFTAAGFNTLMYRDLGGERYTIIYVHAGDWPKYRDGIWTLHCTIKGIEDSASGVGTGTTILSVYDQAKHFAKNYLVGNQLTTPVPVPTWDGGDPKVEESTFDAVKTDIANVASATGYTAVTMAGAIYIGQAYLKDDLIAMFAVSGDFNWFITRRGAVAVRNFNKATAAAVTWTEKGEIAAGSFQHRTLDVEHANELAYRHGERYVQSGWKGDMGTIRNNVIIAAQGRKYILPQPVELSFLPVAYDAQFIMDLKLRQIWYPPVEVVFTVSLVEGHDRECGDVIALRHTDPGWMPTARKLRIHAIEPNLDTADVVITARDHDLVSSSFIYWQSIATLTRVGKVATANFSSPHGLTTGDRVQITEASPAGYQGTYFITVIDADTFTYTMLADPGASGTGAFVEHRTAPVESGLPPPRKTKVRRTTPVPIGDIK